MKKLLVWISFLMMLGAPLEARHRFTLRYYATPIRTDNKLFDKAITYKYNLMKKEFKRLVGTDRPFRKATRGMVIRWKRAKYSSKLNWSVKGNKVTFFVPRRAKVCDVDFARVLAYIVTDYYDRRFNVNKFFRIASEVDQICFNRVERL